MCLLSMGETYIGEIPKLYLNFVIFMSITKMHSLNFVTLRKVGNEYMRFLVKSRPYFTLSLFAFSLKGLIQMK